MVVMFIIKCFYKCLCESVTLHLSGICWTEPLNLWNIYTDPSLFPDILVQPVV